MKKIITSLLLIFVQSIIFLGFYVQTDIGKKEAIIPHLNIVFFIYLATLLVDCLFIHIFQKDNLLKRMSLVLKNLIVATIFGLLWLYYLVIIIGIHYWGSVTSKKIISHYFLRLSEFGAIDWATPGVTIGILMVWIGLVFGLICKLSPINPVSQTIMNHSRKKHFLVITALMFISVIQNGYGFNTKTSEPLSLTLSNHAAYSLEGHLIFPSVAIEQDKKEQIARMEYASRVALDQQKTNKPNIIFIVVDALRADHMGIYGYQRETTPFLSQEFSKNPKSMAVQNVHSTCSDSGGGLLSTFSSKYPAQFSFQPITLHEALRFYGYKQHVMIAGDQTHFVDLKQYYGKVTSFSDGPKDDALLIEQLKEKSDFDGTPTLMHFHLMSSHVTKPVKYYGGPYEPYLNYIYPSQQKTENKQAIINFYDNGVLHADYFISQILKELKTKKYMDNTIVVIVGDHGDGLGEHGEYLHANNIYEEMTKIPFIMMYYGKKINLKKQIDPIPSQVDIIPTLLETINFKVPNTWQGHSIDNPQYKELIYLEARSNYGLIDKKTLGYPVKYLTDTQNNKSYAFNLKNDPLEKNNIIKQISTQTVNLWDVCLQERKYISSIKNCK